VEAKEGLVGARRVPQVGLSGDIAQNEVPGLGGNTSDGTALVPRQAVLAAVDELERAGLEGGRDLRQGGIAGVGEGHVVARGVAERGVDSPVEWPCHEQESLGHLSGQAVGETAVAGHGIVGDLATLRAVSKEPGTFDGHATYQETDVLGGVLLESIRGQRQTEGERRNVGTGGPGLEGDTALSIGVRLSIGRLRRSLLQAYDC